MCKGLLAIGALVMLMVLGSSSAGAADERVLGADGYRQLKLGMTRQQAEDTGLLRGAQHGAKCTFYYFVDAEGRMPSTSGVFISERTGVGAIGSTDLMNTPEHIGLGSKLDQLRRAYPKLKEDPRQDGVFVTPVPGNDRAVYEFVVTGDEVQDFVLQDADWANACV
ncbi:hypothetical protein D5S17_12995 [Pseudonocardiaceae bacterium YIM PH 21723]|nr:hypothetical protein D5S17_12995 [Pseudonocardiaceae bacterium YIM PH 21723]